MTRLRRARPAPRGSPPASRRRSGPPRPRSRRRGRSRSRPPGRASPAASSRASPRRRGGSARGRAPASRAGSSGRAARCRRASSRSGGRARRRRPSSGRSRRRSGRRCRRRASRRGSSRPARSLRGRAAARAPGRAGTSARRRSRRAAMSARARSASTASSSRSGRRAARRRARSPRSPRAAPASPPRPGPQLVAPAREGVDHRFHHHPEARHPAPLVGREVGAAVEGHAVGVAEDRHRPAAVAGHRLHRLHVEGVDVGALLAVDLDVDEVLVHVGGGLGVLEGLVLHHVAPVAGGVADREQDRAVLVAGAGQRLLAPRVPVDRVVAVLKQVGAGLPRRAVRHELQPTYGYLEAHYWSCEIAENGKPCAETARH